jgi:hypothetical protein
MEEAAALAEDRFRLIQNLALSFQIPVAATPVSPASVASPHFEIMMAPPKKPLSAYRVFVAERMPVIDRLFPNMSGGNKALQLLHDWGDLSPEDRERLEKQGALNQRQYRLDLLEYQKASEQWLKSPGADSSGSE